jgi:flavin-dependent dehydrogenase
MTHFDAAIVGGGPAGCSAAITLAQCGARVVLFEAKTYPHHKVCGEFLSPECAALLDLLGLTSTLRSLAPVMIETACITAPGGTAWETRLPGVAWGLSRRALDAALAQRASMLGVDVRQATTVTAIHGNLHTGFGIEARASSRQEQFFARTVIAAHGKRSALDRALNRRFFDQPQPFVALKAHFRGPHLPGRIELHTFPGGYCGMSEIEDGSVNVCLLAREAAFRNARRSGHTNVDAFIQWMQSQNPRLRRWFSQASPGHWLSIAQIPFSHKPQIEGDILMAGDAAGLIAPLAGDGIAMALRGGQLAASHMARFLAGEYNSHELKRHYLADWKREFAARLRLGRALQAVMLRPYLLSPGLRLLTVFPPIADYLVRHTRDLQSLRSPS